MKTWANQAPTTEIEPELLEYFVHMIVRKWSITDKYKENHQGFVPLYSMELKKVSPKYRMYLEYLQSTQVIDINESYSTLTGRTKAYRLKRKYQFVKIVAKQLTNRKVKSIHQKVGFREATRMRKADAQYRYLTKWLDGLSIDREAAMAYIDDLERTCELWYGRSQRDRLFWRFNMMRIHVERIVHKDHSYLVDDSGNRFHSNLTSMNKELRHFLTYKGKPLGGVDIKNSQPFLSQLLLSPGFWQGRLIDERKPTQKSRHRKLLREGKESPESLYLLAEGKLGWNDVIQTSQEATDAGSKVSDDEPLSLTTNTTTIYPSTRTIQQNRKKAINMFLHRAQVADKEDITLFLKKINEGLYEFLMEQIPIRMAADVSLTCLYTELEKPTIDRDFVKKLTMVALYSHPHSRKSLSRFARRVFGGLFPTMQKLFALIKRDDYTLLPVLLQRIEAALVLDRICKEFVQKYQQPVFTIHDGLITTTDYIPKLKAIAESGLKKAIGAAPKLEPEVWSPEIPALSVDTVLQRMLTKNSEKTRPRYKAKVHNVEEAHTTYRQAS